jgi:hypothetical protein
LLFYHLNYFAHIYLKAYNALMFKMKGK